MGFFSFTKGELMFVFVMLIIGVVSLLLGQYVFVGESWAWHPLTIFNGMIFWVTSFPAILLTIWFKPFGILKYVNVQDGNYSFLGWVFFLFINFIFWYFAARVFAWIFNKFRKKQEA